VQLSDRDTARSAKRDLDPMLLGAVIGQGELVAPQASIRSTRPSTLAGTSSSNAESIAACSPQIPAPVRKRAA
jgi:hypothetical protein